MNGMATHTFHGWSTEDFAVSHSFTHEFKPSAAICELYMTSANERDDRSGTSLGFLSYTYQDPDGTPHDVAIDFAARRSAVGHDRMTRVEWYMRLVKADSAGLLNIFFWDSVS